MIVKNIKYLTPLDAVNKEGLGTLATKLLVNISHRSPKQKISTSGKGASAAQVRHRKTPGRRMPEPPQKARLFWVGNGMYFGIEQDCQSEPILRRRKGHQNNL